MPSKPSKLSRRNFVENSALAAGVFGAAGLAATTSPGADAAEASATAANLGNNARQFGVKGDGRSDDSRALQAAIDAAQAKGPICYLPAGLYRLEQPLTVPAGVTLCGASGGVPHS